MTERRSTRLVKFSATGKFLAAWSLFSNTAVHKAVRVDRQGNVYVADITDQHIIKLTATGKVLAIWKNAGPPLAIDAQNNVYAAIGYPQHGNIVKLSPNGKQLAILAQATCYNQLT